MKTCDLFLVPGRSEGSSHPRRVRWEALGDDCQSEECGPEYFGLLATWSGRWLPRWLLAESICSEVTRPLFHSLDTNDTRSTVRRA